MVRKDNDFQAQNVCVVFKDMAFDPLVETKSDNSIGYLFKKACRKEGLELCGLRLLYLDDKHREEYQTLFHKTFDAQESWDRPVLALLLRGVDAINKVD